MFMIEIPSFHIIAVAIERAGPRMTVKPKGGIPDVVRPKERSCPTIFYYTF